MKKCSYTFEDFISDNWSLFQQNENQKPKVKPPTPEIHIDLGEDLTKEQREQIKQIYSKVSQIIKHKHKVKIIIT